MYKQATYLRWLIPVTLGFFFLAASVWADNREVAGELTTSSSYSGGATVDLDFSLTVGSPDWEYVEQFNLTFPEEFTINSATPYDGTTEEPEINGQTITWNTTIPIPNGGGNWEYLTRNFSVNVTAAPDAEGDKVLDWDIEGDGWGADPHTFAGTVVLPDLPFPYPVDFVIASEVSDEQVLLQWGFDATTFVPEVYPFNTDGMSQVEIDKNWNAFLADHNINTNGNSIGNRSVVGYQVWREKAYLPGSMELLGTTTQSQFIDFEWGDMDWGVYVWHVVVLYEMNESDPVASNPLEKEMETIVNVQVVTNSGDSPFGTTVLFTNTDPELELEYGTVIDASGSFSWNDFRRGTYDIEVELPGFTGISETNVDIFDETDFEWLLFELLTPPADLYVTPTGLATWVGGTSSGGGGGDDGFEPYFEDFEANNGGWVSGAISGADHWEWGAPASSMINFAYSGSNVWMTRLNGNYDNNANTYLMRQFDFSQAENPLFSAHLFMRIEPGWDAMVLEYSLDGGDSWIKLEGDPDFYNNTSTSGPVAPPKWSGRFTEYQKFETTMPELAGQANVWLRFRFGSDGSVNDEGVAIDDISIIDMPDRGREFLSYKVFHSGVLVAETGMTEYQYGTNGEALVDGQEYLAEVAAVYSTGQSEKVSFPWIYLACGNYPHPQDFTAEQVVGSLDIELNWVIPEAPEKSNSNANNAPRDLQINPAVAAQLSATGPSSGMNFSMRSDELLWSDNWEDPQTTTQGIVSTYFGGLGAPTMSADDFVVPAGETWELGTILARGFLSAGVPSPEGFAYSIFADDNGAPGDLLFEETLMGTFNPALVEIELDTPITLEPGTYWIGVYAYYSTSSSSAEGRWNQYMWNPTTTPGNLAMLNDYANLFGIGDLGWVTLNDIGVAYSTLDFALFGEAIPDGPGEPTIDEPIAFTRIYRNGEVIAEVEGTSYLDEELEFGDYEYCITFVFESGAESCQNIICAGPVSITGNAFVNGTVTNFDGSGPIGGAEIMISNDDFSFTFTTNAAGFYEGELVAGVYDYFVSADGFTPETLEGVEIVYDDLVTNDFVLVEFPYPVGNVVAVDQGSNALIYWNTPGTSGAGGSVYEDFSGGMPSMIMLDNPTASWSVANDMLNLNTTGTNLWRSAYYDAEFDDFLFEVEMQRTAGATTGSMGIYVRGNGFMDLVAGNGLEGLVFTITQGGSYWYGTMINGDLIDWTGWLTTGAINTAGSNVISAAADGTTVQFFVNGTLVHTVNNTTLTEGYCGVHSHEGTAAMTTVWDYWMIEPGAVARDYAIDQTAAESKGTLEESLVVLDNAVDPQGVKYHTAKTGSTRELNGYNVWRAPCYDPEDLTFLGYTLDTTFVDNQFGTLPSGVWSWAVEAVYTYNNAVPQYSNCLDVNMVTMVTVNVQTNSGQSPEETEVMFVNTSEPDLELVYEVELDDSGTYTWEDFRKGTYDIMVEKSGFAPIYLEDVVIDVPSTFDWILLELLLPVEDLYVTPTAFATWRSGGDLPFEPYFQDFNEGLPETWTIVPGGTTADTWFWTPSYSGSTLDGSPFMFVDSDGAGIGPTLDEMLYSPVIDAQNAETLYLMFDQYYRHLGSQFGRVEVYDGSDWVTVLNQTVTAGAWGAPNAQMIDVTEYINEQFQVRFHFNDAGGWNWYWAVDNFAVIESLETFASREPLSYTIWLDGVVKGSTTNEYFQYDTETLVEGDTYLAEVAAVYTTGMSARMQYEFTFFGCENFPAPTDLTAVVDGDHVTLNWGGEAPPPPPGGEWYEISYHNGVPADAYYQQFNYGYGVVYDLSGYSNVTIEKLDYRHSPWGIFGTWDYKLHIVDWDTYTLIQTTDVMQSTLDNGWEVDIPLGSLEGSGLVGIFLEPMGNSAADAYPCLDGDGVATSSSFFGQLPNWSGMANAGVVGNFLMDLWILADPQRGSERQLVKAPVLEANGTNVQVSRNPAEPKQDRQTIELSLDPNHIPGGSPEIRNREDVVLNYDGDNFDAIGLTAGGTFTVAARFPTSMVNPYEGYIMSTVDVYINDVPSTPTLKIYSAGSATAPGSIIHEQVFTATANSWVTIELNDDVELDGTDIWVGYTVTHGAGFFPAGCDAGPANVDGAWISTDGVSWDRLYELAPALNYNWNIRATITDDNGGGGGGGGIPEDVLGANIYRNGVLIAEMVEGDTYTDEGVLPGEYEYCVTFVYDLGAESCPGDPCVTVEVTCEAPINLDGDYVWNYNQGDPEFGALITWEPSTAPVADWLYYDDGINVDGIGGPDAFTWAIKFDPAQLSDYDGASLTKIQIYNRLASTDELRIYEGTNAATLLHTQPLAGLPVEAWSEVDLTSPVLLDVTKQLWIAVYTTDGVNFPAGCGAGQNQPNGDLITLDGVVWEHLTDFGLIYTWNLRGFVTTAVGATVALPMEKPADAYAGDRADLKISGQGTGMNNVLDINASRDVETFNLYRAVEEGNYSLIATIPYDPAVTSYEYFDTDVDAGVGYYYQVTAMHSYDEGIECESPPAMALDIPENDFVFVLITSVDDMTTVEARLYPNPANNNITIEAKDMQRITMVNALGQLVYESEVANQSRVNLNTAHLEAGMYIVRVLTADGIVTSRVNIVR